MTLGLLSGCGYARQHQQLHEQHTLLKLLSWAYSVCVLLLCCFSRVVNSVTLNFVSFSLLFAGFFVGHFENMIVPCQWPRKLHFMNTMVPYQQVNYPLDLQWEHGCKIAEKNTYIFKIFTTWLNKFKLFMVRCSNTYIQRLRLAH